jgi:segregation and condensation protein B
MTQSADSSGGESTSSLDGDAASRPDALETIVDWTARSGVAPAEDAAVGTEVAAQVPDEAVHDQTADAGESKGAHGEPVGDAASAGAADTGAAYGQIPTVEGPGQAPGHDLDDAADDVASEPSEGEPDNGGQDELADPARLRAAVEAVLLVVDSPTEPVLLAQVLGRPVSEVEQALHSLQAEYDCSGRGLDLRQVAGGWRLYSREEFAGYVERFVLDGQQSRLTQAALETLAVIAYRQPVTRSRVSAIRGVSVDAVMRTLLTRGLVEECGADPETGGGLYRTTSLFLEKLGLQSLDALPSLAPLLPDTSQLDDVELST